MTNRDPYLYDYICDAYVETEGKLQDYKENYGFSDEDIEDFFSGKMPIPNEEHIESLKNYARDVLKQRLEVTNELTPSEISVIAEKYFGLPMAKWNCKAWARFALEISLPYEPDKGIFKEKYD